MKIALATTNKGKICEFRRMLVPMGFEIITLDELGYKASIEEVGQSFEENAFIKATEVYKAFEIPTIADDSGLEIDILGGFPGIYSARFDVVESSFADKCEKILDKMKGLKGEERAARFVCVICFVVSSPSTKNFEDEKHSSNIIFSRGECVGTIAEAMSGVKGFGYDPIFMFEGKTLAELEPSQKDSISHRGNALRVLREKLIARMIS